MPAFIVTFSAAWVDHHGVKWTTGKQKRTVDAESRTGACLLVCGSWPNGAEGECKAEPKHNPLMERVRANVAAGKPPSTWDESITQLAEWPTVDWLRQ